MAETSITIFSQCHLLNSFLPVFDMPGYTPNMLFYTLAECPVIERLDFKPDKIYPFTSL